MKHLEDCRADPVDVVVIVFGGLCALCAMVPIFAGYWLLKLMGVVE
jgi:hypothetical protein